MRFTRAATVLTAVASPLLSAVALAAAHSADDELDEVVVFGRGELQIGEAAAASEGVVGGADLSVRPLLRVAELLEAVPGMIAAQHSGSGKANQYFLRGFQLDHGTDFTAVIDGMPWNFRTHGHGQGYLDVNGLIPEVISRIEYRKGPYRADLGDFSLAGAAFMTTIDRLDSSFVAMEGGEYDWRRAAAGGTTQFADGELTAIGQWKSYNGPWELPEDLKHYALWSKYVRQTGFGALKLSLSAYRATWHPTEQMPELSFGTAACEDEFCTLDPSAFGKTLRWIGTLQLESDNWSASGYAQFYDWHMLADPTYDYQINQFDRRWTIGGRYDSGIFRNDALDIDIGAELRHDRIPEVGFDHTDGGVLIGNIANNSVRESSAAVYSEATWKPTTHLRLMAGLRADAYDFDVGINPGAGADSKSGDGSDEIVSPKLAAAYRVSDSVELYANWGRGFHSNDARGVVDFDTPVPGLVKGSGHEGGMRFEKGGFNVTLTHWWLDLSSELIFVGDSNAVEPKGGSKRRGFEIVSFWKPVPWLGLDVVYTQSRARYREDQGGGAFHVEGGVEEAGEFGASAVKGKWEFSTRVRYLGPYALTPDNAQRADTETLVNLRLAYKPGNFTIYGELLNVFDSHGKDIEYYYATFVPGVSAPGTQMDAFLSRASEPRTVRVGVKYSFHRN